MGFVGVGHGVALPNGASFGASCTSTEGRPRCAASCPKLIDLICNGRQINPGKVLDLRLSARRGRRRSRAMDEREAIKVLLRP